MTGMPQVEIQDILSVIRSVLGPADQPIPLHEPTFGAEEKARVSACIESGWASSAGGDNLRFEQMLAEYCGVPHAVVCMNGTAALHIALHLAGVMPGDEVLVPAITFIATANAVVYNQAVPHFVEVSQSDFGIDVAKLRSYLNEIAERRNSGIFNRRTGRRLAAIVPVHCFGYVGDIEGLVALAEEFGLPLVEDAAESLGTTYNGRAMGTFGKLAVLSFNGNKIITTGSGGAILTADKRLADEARHLTTTAKMPHAWRYVHDKLGYNYRLPSLNAALGVAQMGRLPVLLAKKRKLHAAYRSAFAALPQVGFLHERPGSEANHWLNTILLPEGAEHLRDPLLQAAHDAGYLMRPVWDILSEQAHLRNAPVMPSPVAQSIAARAVNLPSSPLLADRIGGA